MTGIVRQKRKQGKKVEGRATASRTTRYAYDSRGRVATQTVNGRAIRYTYTPHGQLASKTISPQGTSPAATLTYTYSRDGIVLSRGVNGDIQRYFYDPLGQLIAVRDAGGNPVEEYAYDLRGNITQKTVAGVTTEYTYDKANQLVEGRATASRLAAPEITSYAYDAAGRLIREGDKTYSYGYLDKVMAVKEKNNLLSSFDYAVSGQIASATRGGSTENFLWDGLALIHRSGVNYLNEPHAGGGAPVLAGSDKILFNDLLGSTVGTFDSNGKFASTSMTTYGDDTSSSPPSLRAERSNPDHFFTGKPHVAGLGHAFLLRNYRPDLGKWQSADPLGYPDGLNNFAYVNGRVTSSVDWLGASGTLVIHSSAEGGGSASNTDGHAWITYTDDATGITISFGTWGNKDPVGLHQNLELYYESLGAYKDKVTRSTHLSDTQEKALMDVIKAYRDKGTSAWGYLKNCAAFAAEAWKAATGEDFLAWLLWTTPSSLKDKIIDANGGKKHGVKE